MNKKIKNLLWWLVAASLFLAGCAAPVQPQIEQPVESPVVESGSAQAGEILPDAGLEQASELEAPVGASAALPEADAAVEAFYTGYLTLARQSGREPLARWREVRSSLTPGFADFLLESDHGKAMNMNGFDLLLGSSIVPADIQAGRVEQQDESQAAMRVQRFWSGFFEGSDEYIMDDFMTVRLQKVGEDWLISGVELEQPEAGPAETLQAFYEFYLLSIRGDGQEGMRNPLAEGADQDWTWLTARYKAELADQLAGMQDGGYDPLLCAQDIPEWVRPEAVFGLDYFPLGNARVAASTSFPNHFLTAEMALVGGRWQLAGVRCAVDPAGMAEAYFIWRMGREAAAEREPATPGAGAPDEAFLTGNMLAYLEQYEQAGQALEFSGHDPVLLAQTIPLAFTLETAPAGEDRAEVTMFWNRPEYAHLNLEMVLENGSWKIDAVHPGAPGSPESVTSRFYQSYLQYARTQGNPLVDGFYRQSDDLTGAFVSRIADELASAGLGGFDPLLLAQDIPMHIDIGRSAGRDGRVQVPVFEYWTGSIRQLQVELVKVDGSWKIDAVTAVE